MPETRKHRVEPRDEIDRALFAALGEPVRPATPGSPPATTDNTAQEASTPPVTPLFVTPGSTLGAFTVGQRPAEQP